jgi:hypothetical protein
MKMNRTDEEFNKHIITIIQHQPELVQAVCAQRIGDLHDIPQPVGQ